MQFHRKYLADVDGGRRAAIELHNQIEDFIQDKEGGINIRPVIHTMMFMFVLSASFPSELALIDPVPENRNMVGLGGFLEKGTPAVDLRSFAQGFNSSPFAVGCFHSERGKSVLELISLRAHRVVLSILGEAINRLTRRLKVRAFQGIYTSLGILLLSHPLDHLTVHIHTSDYLILGGAHDSGYAASLHQLGRETASKVIILQTTPVLAQPLADLNLEVIQLPPGLFEGREPTFNKKGAFPKPCPLLLPFVTFLLARAKLTRFKSHSQSTE